ncbi:MAG: hypothetical protein ABSH41_00545, partial [Syntrophobacteraceae bacterium]
QFAAVAAPRHIKSSVFSSIMPSPSTGTQQHFAGITDKTRMTLERLQDSRIRDKRDINVSWQVNM